MKNSGSRILLLEDDENLRELLVATLEDHGYQVVSVSGGEEAINEAQNQAFELVVVDIRMKGVDGLEALSRIRQNQLVASLVMTGYASESDTVRALRVGAGDYIKKPFKVGDFMEVVERLVTRVREQRRHRASERRLQRLSLEFCEAFVAEQLKNHDPMRAVRVARTCQRLAEGCGLETEEALSLTLGFLWCASRFVQGLELEAPPLPRLRDALGDLGWAAGEAPEGLPEQILWVSWQLLGGATPDSLAGLADPVQRALHSGEAAGQSEALASLAWTLHALGDGTAARAAFELLMGHSSAEALAGLARLALREERPQEAAAFANRLLELGQGRASLEAGILLGLADQIPEARAALERARVGLERPGLEGPAALARLATVWLGGQTTPAAFAADLEQLPEMELAQSLPWLMPLVLEGATRDDGLRGLAQRLTRDYPAAWGDHGKLSARARELAQGLVSKGPELPVLRIQSLGRMVVSVGTEQISEKSWGGQKVRFLFAYIASSEAPVSEDDVLERFWPDGARHSLATALSNIRKAFRGHYDNVLTREGKWIGLSSETRVWHDLTELRKVMNGPQDSASLRRLADLYPAPYMEECYMDWAIDLRRSLDVRVVDALQRMAEQSLAQGELEEALEDGLRAVRVEPLSQKGTGLVMRIYLALGKPELAIRSYESCRRTLRVEQGSEPSLELFELY